MTLDRGPWSVPLEATPLVEPVSAEALIVATSWLVNDMSEFERERLVAERALFFILSAILYKYKFDKYIFIHSFYNS